MMMTFLTFCFELIVLFINVLSYDSHRDVERGESKIYNNNN
jgi:hypothetical protein